jgi:asparagine synthetase B (glutamine-hydrolysing)
MCGITAAIGAISPIIIKATEKINDAQFHRGPDGEGFWSSVNENEQGVAHWCQLKPKCLLTKD